MELTNTYLPLEIGSAPNVQNPNLKPYYILWYVHSNFTVSNTFRLKILHLKKSLLLLGAFRGSLFSDEVSVCFCSAFEFDSTRALSPLVSSSSATGGELELPLLDDIYLIALIAGLCPLYTKEPKKSC